MACRYESLLRKVVIVTGASAGIGKATALRFAQCGSSVVLTGRNQERLDKVKQECINTGLNESQVLALVSDVSKQEDVDKMVEATIQKFNQIDVLVNNAGIAIVDTAEHVNMKVFDAHINTNVRGPVMCMIATLPHLLKTKGNIINVSSVSGKLCEPGHFSYGISKSALDKITKSAAGNLSELHVRVNTVSPGVTETSIFEGFSDPQMIKRIFEAASPQKVPAKPEDVANTIAFLASEEAGFVTGADILVDGGHSSTTCGSPMSLVIAKESGL